MADTEQSTAFVFDGLYGELAQLGLPLPMVANPLKLNNLTLESAMWNEMFHNRLFGEPVLAIWRCKYDQHEEEKAPQKMQADHSG